MCRVNVWKFARVPKAASIARVVVQCMVCETLLTDDVTQLTPSSSNSRWLGANAYSNCIMGHNVLLTIFEIAVHGLLYT